VNLHQEVDSHGCIDLSDILKVTEGYEKSVSLSVMSGNEVIFRKESQIEERELRLLTELPDCCAAGTNLMNLIFQVTELDGSLDTSNHHDEKSFSLSPWLLYASCFLVYAGPLLPSGKIKFTCSITNNFKSDR